MQQIMTVWGSLTTQRRALLIGAAVAMIALVAGLARLSTSTDMDLLYSGLEPGAAGDIVAALEAQGAQYEVRGGAIFVDARARDALRMTLAAEGLPANVSDGYELLDKMSGFGTTSQMFDAAYWRAKEGELARTIVSSPSIRAARVHIANSSTKPFQRDATPTAAVTVTPAGGGLSAQQAKALRYLVAAAVSGLAPENVSVIDSNGGVILAGDETPSMAGASGDKAAALKRNVERLLEARVGYGKAVVEVNVDTVTDSEQITERRIDPDSRIAISQDTTQTSESSKDGPGGDVTVASNLPDGDAAKKEGASSSQASESRERINYEVSQTERQLTRMPGAISRITTAVLVDGIRTVAEDGTVTWAPRPAEEMEALRELVSAAVGFDGERGDTLSLRSMEFEPLPVEGSGPAAASLLGPIDAMRLIQIAVLAVVALILGLFVVRPILSKAPPPALAAPRDGTALTGEIDPEDTPANLPDARRPIRSYADPTEERSAVDRLRHLIDERQDESLQILKSWMEDDGEKA